MTASSGSMLAAVFALSMLCMFLVPWTIYRFVNREKPKKAPPKQISSTETAWGQAALQAEKLRGGGSSARSIISAGNVTLILLWLLAAALAFYIGKTAGDVQPFDPWEILSVDRGATEKEVKRAYRQASLLYHPDKNPDPAAHKYFAEKVAPAYKALTDEKARKNLEQFGHPDGSQGIQVGIALPAFLFEPGKAAPLILFGFGILLPLGLAVWYVNNSSKYSGGANSALQQTMITYYHLTEQKNFLAPSKVAELLAHATEFWTMPAKRSDEEALLRLVQALRGEINPKDPKFAKFIPGIQKSLILLAAQVARLGPAAVPEALQADFAEVVGTASRLLPELLKMTLRPRPPHGYVWLRPLLSVLEYSQHLCQAVPLAMRSDKASDKASSSSEHAGSLSLLQLPHVDEDAVRALTRRKVRSIYDLLAMEAPERTAALLEAKLSAAEAGDAAAHLAGVPAVTLSAVCEPAEGAEALLEGEVGLCTVTCSLEREGAGEPAQSPFAAAGKAEGWYLLLCDPATNWAFVVQKVELKQQAGLAQFRRGKGAKAEAAAAEGQLVAAGKKKEGPGPGQEQFQLAFRVPPAGTHNLVVQLVSDYWLGCEARVALKLKVGKMQKAELEKRQAAAALAAQPAPEEDGEGASDEEDDGGPQARRARDEDEFDAEDEAVFTESGTEESDASADEE